MLDVKLLLAASLLLPVLSLGAIQSPTTILAWSVVSAAIGAYCLVAAEVIAMLLGETKLSPEARRLWWALALLRFSLGLPIGAFGSLAYAVYHPEVHQWLIGGLAFVLGWSGLALKPALDKVLAKRIEQAAT